MGSVEHTEQTGCIPYNLLGNTEQHTNLVHMGYTT